VLTERELEVLRLMATGSTNAQIASELVISQGTVKSHVKHILRKLHASNRAQAVSRAFRILDTHERGAD
jgi:DNA-binding NarL/FixJ family response regulator